MIDYSETIRQAQNSTSECASVVYRKPTPAWDAIRGAEATSAMNLSDYENVSMDQQTTSPEHLGTVLNIRQFLAFGKE
jgi:hypothetical protein